LIGAIALSCYTGHMKSITVLIPVYNEEEVLPTLFDRLTKLADSHSNYTFEFLFVNDGGRDKSLKLIESFAKRDHRASYVNLTRNFGKEVAMIAGIDHVKSDALVIMDADLQDPPELLPDMIKLWEEGYDDVYARRTARLGESWLKRTTSHWYYKLLQHSTSIEIQPDTGDFRLLDKRCIAALQQLREHERYTKGLFSWIGFNKKEITYVREPRVAGKSKWDYFKLINLAVEGVTSFTTAPLRLASLVGLVVSVSAFIYIIVLVVRTAILGPDVSGYPSLMAVILFLGGVQLLSLGIIGEYIGRIFNETKQRPLYLVEKYHQAKKAKKAK
jgi:glycosyltransferase involved in cell wall biosynthesis